MELNEIKKSPKAIPIKILRQLKRNIILKNRGKILKRFPKKITNKEFYRIYNVKNSRELFNKINSNFLFTEPQSIGKNQNKEVIQKAEKILNKRFEILKKQYKLKEINWHKDPETGKSWKLNHYSSLSYGKINKGYDIKNVWNFNRCYHFVDLGIAYQKTNKQEYKEEFKEQVTDWIQKNPYEFGPNWLVAMEVAIRSINWIFAYHLFKDKNTNGKFWLEYLKQMHLKGEFIKNNLEWSTQKENHYICDIVGLFFIGVFLKNKKWIAFSKKELEKEIRRQVSSDGVHYEASINYHRLVTELFLLTQLLAKKNNINFSKTFHTRLENMLKFIMYYTKPSGQASCIGDTDNCRVIDLWNKDTNDHRELLTIGSILYNRGDFKNQGTFDKKLIWLIGYENFQKYKKIKKKKTELNSKKFKDFFIMRDKDFYLIIHCGDIGREGFGSHGHCDQLSFELFKGKDIIVDPGTYTYTKDTILRHIFRSTSYHNTLKVNNKEIEGIKVEKPFSMEERSDARCEKWVDNTKETIFIGKHKGFDPYIHAREIIYNKRKKEVIITDTINNKPKKIELNLHFDPGTKIKEKKDWIIDNKIKIFLENANLIDGFVSKAYGVKEKAKILQSHFNYKSKIITRIKFQ